MPSGRASATHGTDRPSVPVTAGLGQDGSGRARGITATGGSPGGRERDAPGADSSPTTR